MAAGDPITVVLVGAPVPFARMRTGNGHHFVPAKQRNAAAIMRIETVNAMRQGGWTMFDEAVFLTLRAVLPIPQSWSKKKQQAAIRGEVWPAKKPDLDNLAKLVTDAMSLVAYRDDAQIVRISAAKVFGVEPSLIVTVRPAILTTATQLTPLQAQEMRRQWNEQTAIRLGDL